MDLYRKHPAPSVLVEAPRTAIDPSLRGGRSLSQRRIPRAFALSLGRWGAPLTIGLIAFEVLIRTAIYSPRPKADDPALGRIPAPGTTWVEGTEGYGRMHWNRAGLRGREMPADPAVPRVAVLGDSYCEAAQVQDDETFSARLAQELSRRQRREVWVGNCGRSGLQAGDYLYYAPVYERKLRPQAIVVAFTETDFTLVAPGVLAGTTARLEFGASADEDRLTYHPERMASEIDRLPQIVRRPVSAVVDHSGLGVYSLFRLKRALSDGMASDRPQEKREQRIATTPQIARYLARLRERARVPLVCLYIHPCNPLRGAHDHREEERLREATSALGIPFLGTGTLFREQFARSGEPGNGFHWSESGPGRGHLNREGHALVARALAAPVEATLAAHPGPGLSRR